MDIKYTLGNTVLQNRLYVEQDLLSMPFMRDIMDMLQTSLWRQTQNFWRRAVNDKPWNADWFGEIQTDVPSKRGSSVV